MGTEIQGGMNEYERQTSKQQLAEKKDPVWYPAGINKLINRYKKFLTRYGDYRSVPLVSVSVWFYESGFGFSNLAVRFSSLFWFL